MDVLVHLDDQLLFPLLYGAIFVGLLWQAFQVMERFPRQWPRQRTETAPDGSRCTPSYSTMRERSQKKPFTVRFSGDDEVPRGSPEPG